MSNYVTLLGAEQVAAAAGRMASAADDMQRAASTIDSSNERLMRALEEAASRIEQLSAAAEVQVSLRDYLIAHAPAEPQPWFEPVVPQAPTPVYLLANMTPEESREREGWNEGFLGVEDLKQPRVRAWAEAKVLHDRAARAHRAEAEKQRYVQWPAAWADAVMKAEAAS